MTEAGRTGKGDPNALDSRPLYIQVREILLQRISSGSWRPGDVIPNEFAIARELGVSQGTIRKALDLLAADHLLVRRQGRGTYVARHTPADMLFRFFNFFDDEDQRIQPETGSAKLSDGRATPEERERLALGAGARVIRISRIRNRSGAPFTFEKIAVPADLFPGLLKKQAIPNTLYDHFQKVYGLTVARGQEKLTAVAASAEAARALGVDEGTPLLMIDRVMYGVQNQPLEWRVSLCRTDGAAYGVALR